MSSRPWWKRLIGGAENLNEKDRAQEGKDGPERDLTLGQLVRRVADDGSSANTAAFYRRLLFSKVGVTIPGGGHAVKLGTHVTTKDDNFGVPIVAGVAGNCYLAVYCDIPALCAVFRDNACAELDARVVLEMARSKGLGIIVQSATEEPRAQATVPKEDVVDILAGKFSKTGVVPPGHKVVMIGPSPIPYLRQCESGVWIAELGFGKGIDEVIGQAQKLSELTQHATIIWILQPMVLESANVFDAVVLALDSMLSDSRGIVRHSAVVPYATERHTAMMRRLKDINIHVYYGGPHGECFVEAHKPEGIVVGMPGRPFTG